MTVFVIYKHRYNSIAESFVADMTFNQTQNQTQAQPQELYETIDLTTFTPSNSMEELLADSRFMNCEAPVIYYKNGLSGFGSQLTLFTQFAECISNQKPNAMCIPWFISNGDGFQYAEQGVPNSFFLYFEAINKPELTKRVENRENIFVISNTSILECSPFFKAELPLMSVPQNYSQITRFRQNFKLRIGEDVRKNIAEIKQKGVPLIGVHLRSDAQKKMHEQGYLNGGSALTRFTKLKESLDNKYQTNYSMFIATDTNLYVKNVKEIVKNNTIGKNELFFIDNITRIDDESDSMPNIKNSGYEIGCNILYDCLALSLCDDIYVSPSNIMFIIACIGDNTNVNMSLL